MDYHQQHLALSAPSSSSSFSGADHSSGHRPLASPDHRPLSTANTQPDLGRYPLSENYPFNIPSSGPPYHGPQSRPGFSGQSGHSQVLQHGSWNAQRPGIHAPHPLEAYRFRPRSRAGQAPVSSRPSQPGAREPGAAMTESRHVSALGNPDPRQQENYQPCPETSRHPQFNRHDLQDMSDRNRRPSTYSWPYPLTSHSQPSSCHRAQPTDQQPMNLTYDTTTQSQLSRSQELQTYWGHGPQPYGFRPDKMSGHQPQPLMADDVQLQPNQSLQRHPADSRIVQSAGEKPQDETYRCRQGESRVFEQSDPHKHEQEPSRSRQELLSGEQSQEPDSYQYQSHRNHPDVALVEHHSLSQSSHQGQLPHQHQASEGRRLERSKSIHSHMNVTQQFQKPGQQTKLLESRKHQRSVSLQPQVFTHQQAHSSPGQSQAATSSQRDKYEVRHDEALGSKRAPPTGKQSQVPESDRQMHSTWSRSDSSGSHAGNKLYHQPLVSSSLKHDQPKKPRSTAFWDPQLQTSERPLLGSGGQHEQVSLSPHSYQHLNPLMLTPPSAQLRGGRCEHKRVKASDPQSQTFAERPDSEVHMSENRKSLHSGLQQAEPSEVEPHASTAQSSGSPKHQTTLNDETQTFQEREPSGSGQSDSSSVARAIARQLRQTLSDFSLPSEPATLSQILKSKQTPRSESSKVKRTARGDLTRVRIQFTRSPDDPSIYYDLKCLKNHSELRVYRSTMQIMIQQLYGGTLNSNKLSLRTAFGINPLMLTPPSAQMRGGRCEHNGVNNWPTKGSARDVPNRHNKSKTEIQSLRKSPRCQPSTTTLNCGQSGHPEGPRKRVVSDADNEYFCARIRPGIRKPQQRNTDDDDDLGFDDDTLRWRLEMVKPTTRSSRRMEELVRAITMDARTVRLTLREERKRKPAANDTAKVVSPLTAPAFRREPSEERQPVEELSQERQSAEHQPEQSVAEQQTQSLAKHQTQSLLQGRQPGTKSSPDQPVTAHQDQPVHQPQARSRSAPQQVEAAAPQQEGQSQDRTSVPAKPPLVARFIRKSVSDGDARKARWSVTSPTHPSATSPSATTPSPFTYIVSPLANIASSPTKVASPSMTMKIASPSVTIASPSMASTSLTIASPTLTIASPSLSIASPTFTIASPSMTIASPTMTIASPTVTTARPTMTIASPPMAVASDDGESQTGGSSDSGQSHSDRASSGGHGESAEDDAGERLEPGESSVLSSSSHTDKAEKEADETFYSTFETPEVGTSPTFGRPSENVDSQTDVSAGEASFMSARDTRAIRVSHTSFTTTGACDREGKVNSTPHSDSPQQDNSGKITQGGITLKAETNPQEHSKPQPSTSTLRSKEDKYTRLYNYTITSMLGKAESHTSAEHYRNTGGKCDVDLKSPNHDVTSEAGSHVHRSQSAPERSRDGKDGQSSRGPQKRTARQQSNSESPPSPKKSKHHPRGSGKSSGGSPVHKQQGAGSAGQSVWRSWEVSDSGTSPQQQPQARSPEQSGPKSRSPQHQPQAQSPQPSGPKSRSPQHQPQAQSPQPSGPKSRSPQLQSKSAEHQPKSKSKSNSAERQPKVKTQSKSAERQPKDKTQSKSSQHQPKSQSNSPQSQPKSQPKTNTKGKNNKPTTPQSSARTRGTPSDRMPANRQPLALPRAADRPNPPAASSPEPEAGPSNEAPGGSKAVSGSSREIPGGSTDVSGCQKEKGVGFNTSSDDRSTKMTRYTQAFFSSVAPKSEAGETPPGFRGVSSASGGSSHTSATSENLQHSNAIPASSNTGTALESQGVLSPTPRNGGETQSLQPVAMTKPLTPLPKLQPVSETLPENIFSDSSDGVEIGETSPALTLPQASIYPLRHITPSAQLRGGRCVAKRVKDESPGERQTQQPDDEIRTDTMSREQSDLEHESFSLRAGQPSCEAAIASTESREDKNESETLLAKEIPPTGCVGQGLALSTAVPHPTGLQTIDDTALLPVPASHQETGTFLSSTAETSVEPAGLSSDIPLSSCTDLVPAEFGRRPFWPDSASTKTGFSATEISTPSQLSTESPKQLPVTSPAKAPVCDQTAGIPTTKDTEPLLGHTAGAQDDTGAAQSSFTTSTGSGEDAPAQGHVSLKTAFTHDLLQQYDMNKPMFRSHSVPVHMEQMDTSVSSQSKPLLKRGSRLRSSSESPTRAKRFRQGSGDSSGTTHSQTDDSHGIHQGHEKHSGNKLPSPPIFHHGSSLQVMSAGPALDSTAPTNSLALVPQTSVTSYDTVPQTTAIQQDSTDLQTVDLMALASDTPVCTHDKDLRVSPHKDVHDVHRSLYTESSAVQNESQSPRELDSDGGGPHIHTSTPRQGDQAKCDTTLDSAQPASKSHFSPVYSDISMDTSYSDRDDNSLSRSYNETSKLHGSFTSGERGTSVQRYWPVSSASLHAPGMFLYKPDEGDSGTSSVPVMDVLHGEECAGGSMTDENLLPQVSTQFAEQKEKADSSAVPYASANASEKYKTKAIASTSAEDQPSQNLSADNMRLLPSLPSQDPTVSEAVKDSKLQQAGTNVIDISPSLNEETDILSLAFKEANVHDSSEAGIDKNELSAEMGPSSQLSQTQQHVSQANTDTFLHVPQDQHGEMLELLKVFETQHGSPAEEDKHGVQPASPSCQNSGQTLSQENITAPVADSHQHVQEMNEPPIALKRQQDNQQKEEKRELSAAVDSLEQSMAAQPKKHTANAVSQDSFHSSLLKVSESQDRNQEDDNELLSAVENLEKQEEKHELLKAFESHHDSIGDASCEPASESQGSLSSAQLAADSPVNTASQVVQASPAPEQHEDKQHADDFQALEEALKEFTSALPSPEGPPVQHEGTSLNMESLLAVQDLPSQDPSAVHETTCSQKELQPAVLGQPVEVPSVNMWLHDQQPTEVASLKSKTIAHHASSNREFVAAEMSTTESLQAAGVQQGFTYMGRNTGHSQEIMVSAAETWTGSFPFNKQTSLPQVWSGTTALQSCEGGLHSAPQPQVGSLTKRSSTAVAPGATKSLISANVPGTVPGTHAMDPAVDSDPGSVSGRQTVQSPGSVAGKSEKGSVTKSKKSFASGSQKGSQPHSKKGAASEKGTRAGTASVKRPETGKASGTKKGSVSKKGTGPVSDSSKGSGGSKSSASRSKKDLVPEKGMIPVTNGKKSSGKSKSSASDHKKGKGIEKRSASESKKRSDSESKMTYIEDSGLGSFPEGETDLATNGDTFIVTQTDPFLETDVSSGQHHQAPVPDSLGNQHRQVGFQMGNHSSAYFRPHLLQDDQRSPLAPQFYQIQGLSSAEDGTSYLPTFSSARAPSSAASSVPSPAASSVPSPAEPPQLSDFSALLSTGNSEKPSAKAGGPMLAKQRSQQGNTVQQSRKTAPKTSNSSVKSAMQGDNKSMAAADKHKPQQAHTKEKPQKPEKAASKKKPKKREEVGQAQNQLPCRNSATYVSGPGSQQVMDRSLTGTSTSHVSSAAASVPEPPSPHTTVSTNTFYLSQANVRGLESNITATPMPRRTSSNDTNVSDSASAQSAQHTNVYHPPQGSVQVLESGATATSTPQTSSAAASVRQPTNTQSTVPANISLSHTNVTVTTLPSPIPAVQPTAPGPANAQSAMPPNKCLAQASVYPPNVNPFSLAVPSAQLPRSPAVPSARLPFSPIATSTQLPFSHAPSSTQLPFCPTASFNQFPFNPLGGGSSCGPWPTGAPSTQGVNPTASSIQLSGGQPGTNWVNMPPLNASVQPVRQVMMRDQQGKLVQVLVPSGNMGPWTGPTNAPSASFLSGTAAPSSIASAGTQQQNLLTFQSTPPNQ